MLLVRKDNPLRVLVIVPLLQDVIQGKKLLTDLKTLKRAQLCSCRRAVMIIAHLSSHHFQILSKQGATYFLQVM